MDQHFEQEAKAVAETEKAVLGGMIDNEDYRQKSFAEIASNDFLGRKNRIIFDTIKELSENGPVTIPLIVEYFRVKKPTQDGIVSQVAGLTDYDFLGIKAHYRSFRDSAKRRKLQQVLSGLSGGVNRREITDTLLCEARDQIAAIQEDYSQNHDLIDHLESVAYTIEEEQEADFPQQSPILSPCVYSESINMIHGAPGTGKTWISTAMALSLSANKSILPNWEVHNGPYRVLIIDGEMHPYKLRERKNQLCRGGGIKADQIGGNLITISGRELIRNKNTMLDLSKDKHRRTLTKLTAKMGTQFLVLDNLFCLIPGINIKASEEYAPFNAWMIRLQSTGVVVLFVHHDNKSEDFTGANELTFNISTRIHVRQDTRGVIKLDFPKLRDNPDHAFDRFRLFTDEDDTRGDAIEIRLAISGDPKDKPAQKVRAFIMNQPGEWINRSEVISRWREFGYSTKDACKQRLTRLKTAAGFSYDDRKKCIQYQE